MTEHQPRQASQGIGETGDEVAGMGGVAGQADDALAAKLLAAHKLLATLTADPEVKIRLQLRFNAICTALKLPGASKARGARRLDRLMADARRAIHDRGHAIPDPADEGP